MPLRSWAWLRADAWLLGRLLRARTTAVAVLGLVLAWVLASGLGELGIVGGFQGPAGPVYELAFISMALAAGLGSWVLGQQGWIWQPLARGQRAAAEAAFLLLAAGLALGLAWLPALVSGLALPWAAAGAALLHVAALAQLVTRLPAPTGVRPILLVSLLWWIPPLLESEPEPLASLARFLAGPTDVLSAAGIQTRTLAPVDRAPAVACALAAWLLTPRTPRS